MMYPSQPRMSKEDSLAEAQRMAEQRRLADEATRPKPTACADDDERCARWAKEGECEGNPMFMHERCKKACGVCCLDGDVLCERRQKRFALKRGP